MKLRRGSVIQGKEAPIRRPAFKGSAVLLGTVGCLALMGCEGKDVPAKPADVSARTAGVDRPQVKEDVPRNLGVTAKSLDPKKLSVGDEMYFGVTWRSMYKMTVREIGKETVKADVTLPMGITEPSVNIISVKMRLNGVEMPRSKMEAIGNAMRTALMDAKGDDVRGDESAKAGPVKVSAEAYRKRLKSFFSDSDLDLGSAVQKHLIPTIKAFLGTVPGKSPPKDIEVVGRNGKEFILKDKSGDGTIRLDRRVDLDIEFITENAGYFSAPYRMESLSISSDGSVNLKVVPDCSRKIKMEMFMSESAAGKMPGCP